MLESFEHGEPIPLLLLVKRPPPRRRPWCSGAAGLLLGRGGWLRFGCFGFGVLAAEALDAARGVDQLLLAGEKRVAVGADFGVDVAFVGGAGGEVVAAGADDANLVVIGVNFLFGHVAVLGPFRRFFLFYRICGVFTVLRFARRDAGSKRIGRGGRGCILRGLDEALGSRGFGKVTGHRIVSFLLGCWLVGWAGSAARAQRYTTQEVGVGAASETASAYFYALPLYSYTGPRNDFVGPVGRYTWNLSPSLAIEGSVAYLPGYQSGGATDTGHELLALGGVKAGWRGRRFGIYGKAEPGISSWTPGLVVYEGTPQSYRVVDERRTDFTMDMGGVVEIYPTPRTIVRFDGGQTLIPEYDQVTFREGNRQTFELEEIAQGHIAQHFSAAVTVARRFGGLREEREREPARRPLEMGGSVFTGRAGAHIRRSDPAESRGRGVDVVELQQVCGAGHDGVLLAAGRQGRLSAGRRAGFDGGVGDQGGDTAGPAGVFCHGTSGHDAVFADELLPECLHAAGGVSERKDDGFCFRCGRRGGVLRGEAFFAAGGCGERLRTLPRS